MLGAVNKEAPGYEGLRNYIAGGGSGGAGRPTAVSGFDVSARMPVGLPNAALPGAPTPIPTSSAHPGKQTNQRITYARLMTKFPFPATDAFNPDGIYEGDLVFVHRYDGMNSGHDTNKPTRMATIAQLNGALANFTMNAQRDPVSGPGNLPNDPRGYQMEPALPPPPPDPKGNRPEKLTPEWLKHDKAMETYLNGQFAEYQKLMHMFEHDFPKYRWRDCPILGEWTLDGICCATEHQHQHDPMVGGSNSQPGDLFNVAVGGPTLMRNAAQHMHCSHVPEQHIDDGMRTLDKVFVGLVCTEQRNDSGEVIGNEKVSRWARYNIFGGRFWIDLMASIPFDLLLASAETEDAESGTTVALLGLLKLVRLLRLGRIVTFMKMRQGLKLGFKIVQMLTVLLLIVHWTGCIIYGFVSERDSWLPPKDLNNQVTTFYEQENDLQYPVMFYYGLMLIVGNEMAPKNTA